jgi:hypothetical protein
MTYVLASNNVLVLGEEWELNICHIFKKVLKVMNATCQTRVISLADRKVSFSARCLHKVQKMKA